MRTTVTLKDDLLDFVLEKFMHQELTKKFLTLEGTMPDLEYPERGPRINREVLPNPHQKKRKS
jgi:hypothetical protein